MTGCKERKYNNETPTGSTKISVCSKGIEKIDDKYRYSFYVKNNDNIEFKGQVTIICLPKNGKVKFENTYGANIQIPTGKRATMYFDLKSAPINEDSLNGMEKFEYEISIDDELTQKNSGELKNFSKN